MASEKLSVEVTKVPSLSLSKNFDSSKIKKSYVDFSPILSENITSRSSTKDFAVAFVLENIFTPEECQSLITLAEESKFEVAPVNYGDKEVVNADVRSSTRVMLDAEEFVEELWNSILAFIPRKVKGADVVGLNERLRFLKYTPGQFFVPHMDGHYRRPYNKLEISLLTIQMYLNEGFDGGETRFISPKQNVPVKPKTGMALIFDQDLVHEGSLVKNGVKYTVRTDIMYLYGIA